MSSDQPGAPVAGDLNELFDLERIDADLFRGLNEKTAPARPALFGGQVAGQALRAASLTVPEGRMPNSFHGYFLRPGQWQHPVILKVDRDRDGRSFSARHVSAVQEGKVIFSALASFHIHEESPDFSQPLPPAADPDDLPAERALVSMFASAFEFRPYPPVRPYGPEDYPLPARVWAKSTVRLPDDPVLHACALAYLSDIGSGFADGELEQFPRGGPSIDHAMWFHHPARVDEWILLWMWPLKAGGARGLYAGTAHDTAGRLLAVFNQEMIFGRVRPPPNPPSV
ncbi:MAG TPA: acyl-CoA thioesterase domain-containing protein [Acidimicrobiales bacterium]